MLTPFDQAPAMAPHCPVVVVVVVHKYKKLFFLIRKLLFLVRNLLFRIIKLLFLIRKLPFLIKNTSYKKATVC